MNETAPTINQSEIDGGEGMFLLVDKPAGWTSFDVVNKIRHLFRVKKAGHAGTLDPLATGLLIVCTGRRTKELARHLTADKEYEVTIELGSRTASGDAETPVLETKPIDGITADTLEGVVQSFVGVQQQIPPMWSALKVRGKRLYRYAQDGEVVERAPREVRIDSIVMRSVHLPYVDLVVTCSKGTYIRTLAEDIGQALGCGAYVTNLRRTRINTWNVAEAWSMTDLEYRAKESVSPTV